MNEQHTMTDEQLVIRVQSGQDEAFGELMDRYTEKLSRYGKRFLSQSEYIEDIVQDVFIKTYQNINSFDTKRKFSPWIYRIAHNAFVNALRKKSTEPVLMFDFDALVSHTIVDDPEERRKEDEEMGVLLKKGIENLTPAYREIITLFYFENLSYEEISEVLEIPIGTVGIRLSRAKRSLREHVTHELYGTT
jgi:RNA polymerase sigma-70 factor (ECF subfamily)